MAGLIASLSPTQRRAAQLKAEGLSRPETAAAMGVPEHRVRNLWNEARHRLRANMTSAEIAFWDAKFREGPAYPVKPMSLSDVNA